MGSAADDARTWAKGFEDGIGPDQLFYSVLPTEHLRLLIADLRRFASEIEADKRQAESVLASFNLARHALAAIDRLIELGDPWRNPEVLEQIKCAVEDALALAEKQPAN